MKTCKPVKSKVNKYPNINKYFIQLVQPIHISNPESIKDLNSM